MTFDIGDDGMVSPIQTPTISTEQIIKHLGANATPANVNTLAASPDLLQMLGGQDTSTNTEQDIFAELGMDDPSAAQAAPLGDSTTQLQNDPAMIFNVGETNLPAANIPAEALPPGVQGPRTGSDPRMQALIRMLLELD